MTNKQAEANYRLARSTMTQDELSCNYCGTIWEPTCLREETICPGCRRNPAKTYLNAPLGDVPIARIKEAEAKAKRALEAKPVRNIGKPVAKRVKA